MERQSFSRNRDSRRKARTLLGDYYRVRSSSESKGPLTNDVFPVIWLHKLPAETIQSLLQAVVPDIEVRSSSDCTSATVRGHC